MNKDLATAIVAVALCVILAVIGVAARRSDLGQVRCVALPGGEPAHSSVQPHWRRLQNGSYIDETGHMFRPPRGVECAVEKTDE